ncbi:hypothetical protein MKW94_020618 [Papaver nudicaule]|uniref:Uncharacterized protein n=1 Tax=Papaver nudicaule TaxID=74823 RepID=A0AA41VD99_PAPNU|nr:hypothetical protein [Papaver nudicaule]
MAGTILISSSSLLPFSPPKPLYSNISPLSINPQISSLKFLKNPTIRRPIRNPRINICEANNGGQSRKTSAAEELEESFFDDEFEYETDDDEEEDDDENGRESSMDLLVRFVQSMYKKLSKRAKKATRSILPPAISPPLVSFAVDGVLLLTSLSIVKALLQVVCTLGGTVFIVILMVRVIWATMSYFQSNLNGSNQSNGNSYNSTIPAS